VKQSWPNFFIVGAARSGTSSLHEYLSRIRGIHMSPIKEPNFFADEVGVLALHIKEEEKYLSLFQPKDGEVMLGESSVSYLCDTKAASRIHARIPDARIVIILRDPIERAYSQFLYDLRFGYEPNFDFFKAVEDDYFSERKGIGYACMYVECGLYSRQIQSYYDLFGRNRVKVIIFEDEFRPKTKETVQDIVYFLGLRSTVPDNVVKRVVNSSSELDSGAFVIPRSSIVPMIGKFVKSIRGNNMFLINITTPITSAIWKSLLTKNREKPPLTQKAYRFLKDIYKEDVKDLCNILEKAPSWASKYLMQ
jgi:hypothetical protein